MAVINNYDVEFKDASDLEVSDHEELKKYTANSFAKLVSKVANDYSARFLDSIMRSCRDIAISIEDNGDAPYTCQADMVIDDSAHGEIIKYHKLTIRLKESILSKDEFAREPIMTIIVGTRDVFGGLKAKELAEGIGRFVFRCLIEASTCSVLHYELVDITEIKKEAQ